MKKLHYVFTDVVNGKLVYYFVDKKGIIWLKQSKYNFFKVRTNYLYDGKKGIQ